MGSKLPEKPDAILATMGGQAALFDDPLRVLALDDAAFAELVAVVRSTGESLIVGIRRYVGLLAWAAWHRYDEKRYREFVADFAGRLGVDSRNVLEWRRAVTKSNNLPMPPMADARSKARKGAGQTPVNTEPVLIPATSTEAPANQSEGGERNGKTRSAPLDEPPSDPSSRGAGIQRPQPPTGALLAPLPAPLDALPERPPTYRALLSRIVGSMHDLDPEDGGPVLTAEEATFLQGWSTRTVKAWQASIGVGTERKPGRVIKPGDREAKADAIGGKADPATCKHPKQSRQSLGYMVKCGLCDTKVA